MPDFTKILNLLNPEKSKGKTLMILNAIGIGFAAASNTFAAATDKNTSAEDKKFLVPAGGVTGLANLAIYFGMTKKLIDKLAGRDVSLIDPKKLSKMTPKQQKALGGLADKVIDLMIDNKTYEGRLNTFIKNEIAKGKNNPAAALLKDNVPTPYAKNLFRENIRGGFGVVGAFIGAVVGCAVITPILRDVSAYIVQKAREKKNPSLKDKPYRPYFDISHIRTGKYPYGKPANTKRPLSMTSYLAFSHGRTRV